MSLLDMGPLGIIFTIGEKGSGVKKQKTKKEEFQMSLKGCGEAQ